MYRNMIPEQNLNLPKIQSKGRVLCESEHFQCSPQMPHFSKMAMPSLTDDYKQINANRQSFW